MRAFSFAVSALAAAAFVSAKDIVITVGHNTTGNASAVFQPQEVHAELGDTVIFNFTLGNHTATQSTFASPCIPAHESNITINGFDSMFRDAGNGTAISILSVPMLPQNVNTTFWFYDYNTCGQGGVGVINANDSSTATLAGFERNAVRLNGTESKTSSIYPSSTAPSAVLSSASASTTATTSGAERSAVLGGLSAVPLLLVALAL